MPHRIQIRRDRPWQTMPKAIIVARPSGWGNPFRVGIDGTAEECVAKFVLHCDTPAARLKAHAELAGRDLACWCPPSAACHADVLLDWANREPGDVAP